MDIKHFQAAFWNTWNYGFKSKSLISGPFPWFLWKNQDMIGKKLKKEGIWKLTAMTTPASAFCVWRGTFSYIYPSIFASPFCPASHHMQQGFAASKSLSTVKSLLHVACLRWKALPKWGFGPFTIGEMYFIYFFFLFLLRILLQHYLVLPLALLRFRCFNFCL